MQIKPQRSYHIILLSGAKTLMCDITEHQEGNTQQDPYCPLTHRPVWEALQGWVAAWERHRDCTGGLGNQHSVYQGGCWAAVWPLGTQEKGKVSTQPRLCLAGAFAEPSSGFWCAQAAEPLRQRDPPTVLTGGARQDIRDMVLDLLQEGPADLGSLGQCRRGAGDRVQAVRFPQCTYLHNEVHTGVYI